MEGVLTVADVFHDVQRVLGDTDTKSTYSRINDIVEILATESDWDPTRGYVDIVTSWAFLGGPRNCGPGSPLNVSPGLPRRERPGCPTTCCGVERSLTRSFVLPREVDVVLAVNVNGRPSQMHDFWFRWHLNGPGENAGERVGSPFGDAASGLDLWHAPSGWQVQDDLPVCVYQNPPNWGCSVIANLESPADSGVQVRVYGFDVFGQWIRSEEGGVFVDGFLVPTAYGAPIPNPNAPQIRTITRVSKPRTSGYVGLWALNADNSVYQMGMYAPSETEPHYRRVTTSSDCGWARVAFKRRMLPLCEMTDIIFLHSKYAIVLMAKALKKYDDDRIQEGQIYQAQAVNLLIKKQKSISVPAGPGIQVADQNLIADKRDRMD